MPVAQPVYRRIMTDIRNKIESGQLRPRGKLPTIAELAEQYRCSAEPVKMALRILSDSGVLVGHQGRGVYVAPGPE